MNEASNDKEPSDKTQGDNKPGDKAPGDKAPGNQATSNQAAGDAMSQSTSGAASGSTHIAADRPTPPVKAGDPKPGPGRLAVGAVFRTVMPAVLLLSLGMSVFALIGVAQRENWLTLEGDDASSANAASSEGAAQRYICPMMCTPPSTSPGRCPVCGMELVEAAAGVEGDGKSITIEAVARRLVGIQTAQAKRGPVERTIRSIGRIEIDESRQSTISAYVSGRLEKMYANYTGVKVAKGDPLAVIYSPELYSAQEEFLSGADGPALSERLQWDKHDFARAARENLTELGMTEKQIAALSQTGKAQSRIEINSPQSGTVIHRMAVEGDYVKTGEKLFRIADLTSVWLMLDMFPSDAAAIRFGQQVEAEVQSLPGDVFTGRIAFIDPVVDPTKRTVNVRVEMLNLDARLKPGDYATARVTVPAVAAREIYDPALAGKFISPMHPQVIRDQAGMCPLCGMPLVATQTLGFTDKPVPEQNVVSVPRSSVLSVGDDAIVYVESEPGRFEVRRVVVGPTNSDSAVILSGLAAGETVATAGNFLIDSQMQLVGNPSLLDPSKAVRFPPGPMPMPPGDPEILPGQPGEQLDRAYAAYFEIQSALAADQPPPPVAINDLVDRLHWLETSPSVPDEAQRRFGAARLGAQRLEGPIDTVRALYRSVSRAMLAAATVARGPQTANKLLHMYCPMVPGGGGDWMQPDGELLNPYWGSEMLHCGEQVRDMKLVSETP